MLIALITIMLLGGGSSAVLSFVADAQDTVKIVLPKGERQKAALGTLKGIKKRTNTHQEHLKKAGKNLFKALEGSDPGEPEIDEVWAAHFAEVEDYNHDMLDLRFELRDQLTREEWNAIFSNEPEA